MATPKHWQQTKGRSVSSTQLTCQPAAVDPISPFSKAFPLSPNRCKFFSSFFQTNSILFVNWHVILDSKGLAIVDSNLAHSIVIWQYRTRYLAEKFFDGHRTVFTSITRPQKCFKLSAVSKKNTVKTSDLWLPCSFPTFTREQRRTFVASRRKTKC